MNGKAIPSIHEYNLKSENSITKKLEKFLKDPEFKKDHKFLIPKIEKALENFNK